MPRTKRVIPLEEKIKKAEEKVTSTKQKYEVALEELKDLLDKQKAIQNESLLNLFTKSKKSYDEIVTFLSEDKEQKTEEKKTKKQA